MVQSHLVRIKLEAKLKLSVVIPCYNEIDTVGELLRRVASSPVENKEVIVVDDGSKDGTRELLETELSEFIDFVFFHDSNQGKGAALRTGVAAATGDIVVIQDADLEYDPLEYQKLIDPIINNKADVVYGSRFVGSEAHRVLYFWHRLGNGLLTTLSNMCTNINLSDMETCYKAFRREIIQSFTIEENTFGCEPEITAKIAKMDCRIYEVGISYHGRKYEEGKKIGWKDGILAIYCIFKYNFFR